ncbi:sulfate ABC transporter substrate-binding protein, partial [Streptomyces sp. NPDC029216]
MPALHKTLLRRGVAAAAALPLLIGVLSSCGYGSEAKKEDDKANVAATDGAKKLSASEVR